MGGRKICSTYIPGKDGSIVVYIRMVGKIPKTVVLLTNGFRCWCYLELS